MPTYEYRCPKGHNFELFQRMSDAPGADCPDCGQASERLLSAGAGFLFKGSGFYITDYRSDSYKKKAASDNVSSGSGSTSGGGDAKAPAASKEGSATSSGSATAAPAPSVKTKGGGGAGGSTSGS